MFAATTGGSASSNNCLYIEIVSRVVEFAVAAVVCLLTCGYICCLNCVCLLLDWKILR
jgi:hypothetical protein